MIVAPEKATAAYRQLRKATGGMSPINRSRTIPPPNAVAKAKTIIPRRSKSQLMAVLAPCMAKNNVPAMSATKRILLPSYFSKAHLTKGSDSVPPTGGRRHGGQGLDGKVFELAEGK